MVRSYRAGRDGNATALLRIGFVLPGFQRCARSWRGVCWAAGIGTLAANVAYGVTYGLSGVLWSAWPARSGSGDLHIHLHGLQDATQATVIRQALPGQVEDSINEGK